MRKRLLKRLLVLGTVVLVLMVVALGVIKVFGLDKQKPFTGSLNEQVNSLRAAQNLPKLVQTPELDNIAQAKCSDMVQNHYYAHQNSQGLFVWQQYPFEYKTAGENLSWGTVTAIDTVKAWEKSKEHRDNILNPSFTQVGYAYCWDLSSYKVVQVLKG